MPPEVVVTRTIDTETLGLTEGLPVALSLARGESDEDREPEMLCERERERDLLAGADGLDVLDPL